MNVSGFYETHCLQGRHQLLWKANRCFVSQWLLWKAMFALVNQWLKWKSVVDIHKRKIFDPPFSFVELI
jgi:hypothetical protein